MPVNTGNALGAKARFVLRPSESRNELLSGTVPGGASGSTETTAGGLAFVPSSTATTWTFVETGLDPFVSGSFTVHWYGVMRDNVSQTLLSAAGSPYGWQIGSVAYAGGSVCFYIYSNTGPAGGVKYSSVVAATDAELHCLTMRYDAAASPAPTAEFFLDGVSMGGPSAYTKDVAAMGPSQAFSIVGDASKPFKVVTVQGYLGALSNTEIATLVAAPFTIFTAAPVGLTGAASTQANTGSSAAIGLNGALMAANCIQSNLSSSPAIRQTQTLAGASSAQANISTTGAIDPYSRLKAILKPLAKHTWVRVNTDRFLDCTVPDSDYFPGATWRSHAAVVYAWSGFAWDHVNGKLLLWGGGHANYGGNELYIWKAETGGWVRGSLPSYIDEDGYIPAKDAPQSSHTYSNNLWLKNNKMFLTLGGAANPGGGPTREKVSDGPPITWRNVGPWAFDLALADPNKVGGATGGGIDTVNVKEGSHAWYNRRDMVDGTYPIDTLGHANGRAICIDEGGRDVAYFTMDSGGGLPYWYRYEFGDIRNGGRDTCSKVAETWDAVIYEGFGAYDASRGMFYAGANASGSYPACMVALHVSTATGTTHVTPINLVDENGAAFVMIHADRQGYSFGGAYDDANDCIYLWNANEANPGTVFRIQVPAWNISTGWASTTWTAETIVPIGDTPRGFPQTSVLGKFRYIPALGAMVALDKVDIAANLDADVWLFKTAEADPGGLTGAPSTQANGSTTGAILLGTGIHLAAAPGVQGNRSSTGRVSLPGAGLPAPASRTLGINENRTLGVRS